MASLGTCVGSLAVLAALGFAPLPAAAAPPETPADSMMMPGGVPMMDAASLAKAETEIGIRPDQKTEWTAYADAVADALETSDSMHQSMTPKSMSQLSPADRQALMTAMREQREASLQNVSEARARLFSVLNDTQRAKAKALIGEPGPRSMGGSGGMMGGGGMMMMSPTK